MIRRARLFWCCAAVLIGCQSPPSASDNEPKPPKPPAGSFPGHDSPPLAELVKEAKEKVDTAPQVIAEGLSKEAAEDAKKKLEEAGAKVELK